ncbi:MAG TPA: hypothetical protein VGA78_11245 [Gemmatimonadales bacterium]
MQTLASGSRGLATHINDATGAIFDAANGDRGCMPGINEILRRQGLLRGRWCLDPKEDLSPGQMGEIDRVCRAYPHLADDKFVESVWTAGYADKSTEDVGSEVCRRFR